MNSPYRSHPWLGRLLGDNQRYRLDQRLGAGGMGDVFLATDTRIGQQVALKLLKDTLVESPEMRTRFDHEIAICAALVDEHIVKIMDAGVTTEGYPFYVMEYLRGETLGELLRREKQLTVDRTVRIISQVCNGLLLAHQGVDLPSGEYIETVVHRDLKPDNIFLQPTDLGEWVKIVDFGIAKIRYKDDRPQTLTHNFLGTLRYASPEQMMGDRDLDGRSDIYSLGVMLYEMLSGADPFGFNIQPRQMSEASWVIAHTSGKPIPLRSQPGCEHLSPELAAITLRCLEKTPALRFASVAELNLALQAATTAPTVSHREQGQTIVQPRPVMTTAANDETIAKAISPPMIIDPETIAKAISVPPITPSESATIPRLSSIETVANRPRAETTVQPFPPLAPIEPTKRLAHEETTVQPLPPASIKVEQGKTIVQPRLPVPDRHEPPLIDRPQVSPSHRKIPWLKLAIGLLLVLGSIRGIYISTQVTPSEVLLANAIKLVNEDKFSAAIDSATKIPQNSPLYQQAQTLSADAAHLSKAISLANQGKLKEAIDLVEKISPNSPIYKKAQAYLKELGSV